MASHQNINVHYLRSFIEGERAVLLAMARRHNECVCQMISIFAGEPYDTFKEYDEALNELIQVTERVYISMTEATRDLEPSEN